MMVKSSLFKAILFLLVASSFASSDEDHSQEDNHAQVESGSGGISEAEVEIEAMSDPDAVNPNVDNFYLNPYAKRNLSEMTLNEFRSKKEQMQNEFNQYMLDQINFNDNMEPLPGQRVCLPLILKSKHNRVPVNMDYHSFIYRTVRMISDGTYIRSLVKDADKQVPDPVHHKVVGYNSDIHDFIDLGPDFSVGRNSFTVTAAIRLRGDGNLQRGSRVLSMRDSNNDGWEFVVPSYYGKQISFFASDQPGHLDYGQAYVSGEEWTVVGIVVDRDTYPGNIVKVTTYINGVRDGDPTLINFKGARLEGVANLTVGFGRDENGDPMTFRKDYNVPKPEWKRYSHQFFGDINQFSIWHQTLTMRQMRIHAKNVLKKLNKDATKQDKGCRRGFKSLGCTCYKVVNHLASFEDAMETCQSLGGTLAMPKDDKTQTFLEVMMQKYRSKTFWIGLTDQHEENKYKWSDGTDFMWRTDYHRFVIGKPDKQYKTEDCFEEGKTRDEFIWNDEHCNKLNPFICQAANTRC